eukprot:gene50585-19461_t
MRLYVRGAAAEAARKAADARGCADDCDHKNVLVAAAELTRWISAGALVTQERVAQLHTIDDRWRDSIGPPHRHRADRHSASDRTHSSEP